MPASVDDVRPMGDNRSSQDTIDLSIFVLAYWQRRINVYASMHHTRDLTTFTLSTLRPRANAGDRT
jgi:hypothetical protein